MGKPLERAKGLPEDFPRDSTAQRQIITQRNLDEYQGSAQSRPTIEVVRSLHVFPNAIPDETQPWASRASAFSCHRNAIARPRGIAALSHMMVTNP